MAEAGLNEHTVPNQGSDKSAIDEMDTELDDGHMRENGHSAAKRAALTHQKAESLIDAESFPECGSAFPLSYNHRAPSSSIVSFCGWSARCYTRKKLNCSCT